MTSEPGARAPCRDPDPTLADEVDDGRDGEEVRRVAEIGDDGELVGQPVPDGAQRRVARPGIPGGDRGPAALREHPLGVGAVGDAEDAGLGQVDPADPEVAAGVLDAPGGEGDGAREEAAGPVGVAGHRVGGAVHRRGAREVTGVGDPVQVPGVEDDEAAGRVEDVDDPDVAGVGVPDRGGEDRGDPGRVGEAEQGGGMGAGGGGALRAVVVDDLDREGVRWQEALPDGEPGPGDVGAAQEQGPADVGVGSEEEQEPARLPRLAGGVPGDEVRRRDGGAAFAAEVGVGDEPGQGGPAPAVREAGPVAAGEDDGPGPAGVDDGPAADRGPRSTPGCRGGPRSAGRCARLPRQPGGQVDGEVDAEDGGDPGPGRRRREPDRAVEAVAVGEGERGLAVLGGPGDEDLRGRGAVAHREAGGDVEMDEPLVPPGAHGVPAPPWAGMSRSGCSTGRAGRPSRAMTRSRKVSADRSRSSASRLATRRRPCSTSARCRVEWAK